MACSLFFFLLFLPTGYLLPAGLCLYLCFISKSRRSGAIPSGNKEFSGCINNINHFLTYLPNLISRSYHHRLLRHVLTLRRAICMHAMCW